MRTSKMFDSKKYKLDVVVVVVVLYGYNVKIIKVNRVRKKKTRYNLWEKT